MKTYRIVRFYFACPAKNRTLIKTGLTEEEAEEHCNDPETSSRTCQDPERQAHTALNGPWFDGYESEQGRHDHKRENNLLRLVALVAREERR